MEHLDDMIENITRTINHYFNPAGGKTVTFVLMVDNGKEVRYTSNQFKPCEKAISRPHATLRSTAIGNSMVIDRK